MVAVAIQMTWQRRFDGVEEGAIWWEGELLPEQDAHLTSFGTRRGQVSPAEGKRVSKKVLYNDTTALF